MNNSFVKLHIVSFDNPFPPNYGGVIDVFYKLKTLAECGVKITLHAYEYGRKPNEKLEQFCEQVHYYPRKNFVNPFSEFPYIVSTRSDNDLLMRLLQDDAPILFEGLHTCYWLNHPKLAGRTKLVRMHNIEHDYYHQLSLTENHIVKKRYFKLEASRLKTFERILQHANQILAISLNDFNDLKSRYNNVVHIGPFHANTSVTSKIGKGSFAFYHGNLAVNENDEAARFLVNQVFNTVNFPLIIAGSKPSAQLRHAIHGKSHITLMDEANTEQIDELMQNAHINIIPTFQPTGIKLKLINVLYKGRFVIANDFMVKNTGCESLCVVVNRVEEYSQAITNLVTQDFTLEMQQQRSEVPGSLFNNVNQAQQIIALLT